MDHPPAGDMLDRIVSAIDPAMPVAVPVQLRGALEYGIATGEIPGGARLPAVRRLAARLGLSPVTVNGIFAALAERGLVEARVGRGTFAAHGAAPSGAAARRQADLDAAIAAAATAAREMGLSASDLSWRIAAAMAPRPVVRVVLLGSFEGATEAYAASLRTMLRVGVEVAPHRLDADDPPPPADLVVAPRTIAARAEGLYPGLPVAPLTLIPSETCRAAMAATPPGARVAAVSYFDDFLSVMTAGIARFAPHVGEIRSGLRGDAGLPELLSWCDVLVHSTGAEYLACDLAPGRTAIEYRHTPDAHRVRADILPAIEAVRARRASPGHLQGATA